MYKFEDLRSKLDPSLTDHFDAIDNRFENLLLRYPVTGYHNECLEITSLISNIKGNYKKTYELINQAICEVHVNSDNQLIVNEFHPKEVNSDQMGINYLCPIPDYNFWREFHSGIPSDLTFYILDTKAGNYLPDSIKTNGRGMPENFRNGFSKGVAISKQKKKIFYWLIVW